ncbi:hypothetical protein Ana3638_18825 [Anaerocolumna sedimenticola]|uniref:Uncharacterized protein n=1 Tax=Anaerocolumna sedimenticola TaxID=2696063 RepID=A0A6P1TQR7_9FIRM|nr:hypothetical protein [Anaerocolumna sedimenticola]QHQ62579.1 hypothetical protein Ana3638_18825 [Anaerocolumna sedimenticola]
MTTEEIITIAKEKLGKDITEQEAQDCLSGKISLPDEVLDIVNGGGACSDIDRCPRCGTNNLGYIKTYPVYCSSCGYTMPDPI